MAKANSHKGQHFVPRGYLAAWCDPETPEKMDPYVWRFMRDGRSAGKKSPENLFKETDFYTIPMPDGTRNLELENGLSQLEGEFTEVRKKLERHEEIGLNDRVALLAFMVAMSFRTKAHRDFQKGQWGKLVEMADSVAKQFANGRPAPPFMQSDPHARSIGYDEAKEMSERPIQVILPIQMRVTLPIFFSMDIAIVETDQSPGLITSDDPCIWFDPDAYRRPPRMRDPSLMSKDIEVTLPLSPRQIVMLNRKGINAYCKTTERAIEEYNRRAVAYADDFVITSTNAKRDEWFEEREIREDAWEMVHRTKTKGVE
jgi:hypothetical protein